MTHGSKLPGLRVIWVLLLVYLIPIAIYALFFGVHITSDHQRWAELGSALSGIYAPIIALTTLVVLLAQVGLQKQINDHAYNQAYLTQARADLEFYVMQLSGHLTKECLPGQTYRHIIHANFQPSSVDQLDSESVRQLAANLDYSLPPILGMRFGTYPILEGLAAGGDKQFEMALIASKQKAISVLGFETCVAMDNFYRARTEGRLKLKYCFSPLLS